MKIKAFLLAIALVLNGMAWSNQVGALTNAQQPTTQPSSQSSTSRSSTQSTQTPKVQPKPLYISQPTSGASVGERNVEFRGTAPANTLIDVTIIDTDTNIFFEDQQGGRLSGSVTSDSDGSWVFVPQGSLVPGAYTAKATATQISSGGRIESNVVNFIALSNSGASRVVAGWVQWMIVLVILAVAGLVIYLVWRKRHEDDAVSASHRPNTKHRYTPEEDAYEDDEQPPRRRRRSDYDDTEDGLEELRDEADHIKEEIQDAEKDIKKAERELKKAEKDLDVVQDKIEEEVEYQHHRQSMRRR